MDGLGTDVEVVVMLETLWLDGLDTVCERLGGCVGVLFLMKLCILDFQPVPFISFSCLDLGKRSSPRLLLVFELLVLVEEELLSEAKRVSLCSTPLLNSIE